MPEIKTIAFSHKELAGILVKHQGIHEGVWGIFIKFGIGGANVGENEDSLHPAAIVPVLEIGLQKLEKENSISVDASKINPA